MKRESKAKQIKDSIDRFTTELINNGNTYVHFDCIEYEIDGKTYNARVYEGLYRSYNNRIAYNHMLSKYEYVKNGKKGEEQVDSESHANTMWFMLN